MAGELDSRHSRLTLAGARARLDERMVGLKRGEAKFLQGCAQSFLETFERTVADVLRRELRGVEHASVREMREELTSLMRQLESRRVHPAHLPLVRRVLFDGRRSAAAAIE